MPNDFVFYDTTSGEPFTYSKTIEGNGTIDFDCAIADNVTINGMHVEFTISNENFIWHIKRKNKDKDYFDFVINVYPGTGLHDGLNNYWPQATSYIVRVNYK